MLLSILIMTLVNLNETSIDVSHEALWLSRQMHVRYHGE